MLPPPNRFLNVESIRKTFTGLGGEVLLGEPHSPSFPACSPLSSESSARLK
jgi:hypothetical protein